MQQLAGFLSSIANYGSEEAMLTPAAHRLAESVDAEICAIALGDDLSTVIGLQPGRYDAELREIVLGTLPRLEVAGLGTVHPTVVTLGEHASGLIVVGRTGAPLDADEQHLVRAMAQVLELALRLRRTADTERTLRTEYQEQAEELRAANERLLELSQAKTDFVTTTSHELRTPLVAILGFAGLLAGEEGVRDPAAPEYVEAITRHGRRLTRLVDDLLLVGRLEEHRVEADAQRVQVGALLQAMIDTSGREGVRVVGDTAEDVRVLVDPGHLEQMVGNLIENAFKYGAEPVTVEVEARERVDISVCDEGPGVPADFIPDLFERFTQASTGHRRDATGTGLGLSIVDGLATLNGGAVDYRRDDRGRTCFTLHLPRAT